MTDSRTCVRKDQEGPRSASVLELVQVEILSNLSALHQSVSDLCHDPLEIIINAWSHAQALKDGLGDAACLVWIEDIRDIIHDRRNDTHEVVHVVFRDALCGAIADLEWERA